MRLALLFKRVARGQSVARCALNIHLTATISVFLRPFFVVKLLKFDVPLTQFFKVTLINLALFLQTSVLKLQVGGKKHLLLKKLFKSCCMNFTFALGFLIFGAGLLILRHFELGPGYEAFLFECFFRNGMAKHVLQSFVQQALLLQSFFHQAFLVEHALVD